MLVCHFSPDHTSSAWIWPLWYLASCTNETVNDFGAMQEVMQCSNGLLQNCLSNILLIITLYYLFMFCFVVFNIKAITFFFILLAACCDIQFRCASFLRQWTRHSCQHCIHPPLMSNSLSLSLFVLEITNTFELKNHSHTYSTLLHSKGERERERKRVGWLSLVWLCSPGGT